MTLAPTLSLACAAATQWDAAIAGAGPAGAATALGLARRGLRVLLVDRARFPRAKVCGCCLNARSLAALDGLGLGGRLRSAGPPALASLDLRARGRSARLPLPGGVSLSRERLDADLIEAAAAAGASFLPETDVRLIEGLASHAALMLAPAGDTGSPIPIRAAIAIDAGGLTGPSAGASRIAAGARLGAAAIAPSGLAAAPPPGAIRMAVGRGGYVGMVQLEDGRLNLAAAFDARAIREAGGLASLAARILAESGGAPPIPGLADLAWRGTPPLTRRPDSVAAPRLFRVGDAAGYVEPFTGEGIAWALAGALALAPIAAEAAHAWHPRHPERWRTEHARLVAGRQRACRAIAWLLRRPRLTAAGVAALAWLPAAARPVLAALNRPDLPPREEPTA